MREDRLRESIRRALVNLEDSREITDGTFSRASFLRAIRILREALQEGESEEERRLAATARTLLWYREKYGPAEFNKNFGTKEVSGDKLAEFLRDFLQEGED